MASSKHLINEPPILVMPSLAKKLGLNEAIVLQQLHYWVQKSMNVRDGRAWVYNTTKEWAEQFPFWSEDTIKRTMRGLRDKGIVVTANYNQMAMDRTLWYSIDYEALDAIVRNDTPISADCTDRKVQDAPTNNHRLLPETNNTVVVVEGRTLGDVFQCWSNITKGTFNSLDSDTVKDLVDTHGAEAVYQAMTDANLQGKRTLAYVHGILRNRQNGTEKPQQQQGHYNGQRKSKVENSLDAVRTAFAMMREQGMIDEGETDAEG